MSRSDLSLAHEHLSAKNFKATVDAALAKYRGKARALSLSPLSASAKNKLIDGILLPLKIELLNALFPLSVYIVAGEFRAYEEDHTQFGNPTDYALAFLLTQIFAQLADTQLQANESSALKSLFRFLEERAKSGSLVEAIATQLAEKPKKSAALIQPAAIPTPVPAPVPAPAPAAPISLAVAITSPTSTASSAHSINYRADALRWMLRIQSNISAVERSKTIQWGLDCCSEILSREPHDTRVLLLKAHLKQQLGELEDAFEIYEHLLSMTDQPLSNERKAVACTGQAIILLVQEKDDLALKKAEEAVKFNPKSSDAYGAKISVLRCLNRHDAAVHCLNSAMTEPGLRDENILTKAAQQAYFRAQSNYDFHVKKTYLARALSWCEEALGKNPHDMNVSRMKFFILLAQNKGDEANSIKESLLARDPDYLMDMAKKRSSSPQRGTLWASGGAGATGSKSTGGSTTETLDQETLLLPPDGSTTMRSGISR